MKRIASLGLVLGVSLTSISWADELKIGGGGAAIADVFAPVKPHFEATTGTTMILLQSSPKDGLVDLVNGKVDVSVAAVPLESMIAGAEKDGVKVDASALVKTVVGTNQTVLLVHPTNKVSKLTKDQVKGIFTGKIANWKEVGGDDKDIIVVWGKGTPGQNAQLTKEMLDGEAVTKDVLETTNYAKVRETVSATPEGVGIDPFGIADATVGVVETDPVMTGAIIAVTMGKPSPKAQKLLDYIAGEGQKYVKK